MRSTPTPRAVAPWRQLVPLTLAEWRHHPGRHAVALLAVALGVALASSVQMINASALSEFSQAVRAANGEPDAVLAAVGREGFDDALYARLATDEAVALVSPVLEVDAAARTGAGQRPVTMRLAGVDALKIAAIAPALLPRPAQAGAPRGPGDGASPGADQGAAAGALAPLFDPGALYLNPAAMQALQVSAGQRIELASPGGWTAFTVAGRVSAGGTPLAVLDIAAAQSRFGRAGRLTRLDLRLAAGVDREAWQRSVESAAPLPAGVRWAAADDAVQRVSNLSRAYRVNLGVLALVALLVGGFLVYSVVSLSVAQRLPQFALLGVLGLSARDRRTLVLAESAVIGAAGSALGLAAGAALAALALRLLGGDLGGGYFPGVAGVGPALAWPAPALAACFGLGTAAAVVGAWWPARQAERLAPALVLKGLGGDTEAPARWWPGLALLLLGGLMALLPPVAGLPLAAYGAVAMLLAGGVALVPALVQLLLAARSTPADAVLLLALRRARHARATASATVSGVVASLALSVAITVMVASFRDAVAQWLDSVLPADLYLRGSAGAVLPPSLAASAAALPGVARVTASRQLPLLVSPRQPAVALLARPLGDEPARSLPLLGPALPAQPGELSVWVSEPAAAIHGWQPGQRIALPLPGPDGTVAVPARVRGIWRDYARQFGAVVIDAADYRRLSGDTGVNELAVWLAPGAAAAPVARALHDLAGADLPVDTVSTPELRQLSLAIFDRSFAVTLYLQAVAIGVGLVGVAASLSAQVLARRKEFGLLAHLGLTRRQVMRLVASETAAWLLAGVLVGLLLGLAMAVVLVKVVNPQSFHWSMPMALPAARLAALAAAVLAAGIATALFSARRAAGRPAVMAVKEDW